VNRWTSFFFDDLADHFRLADLLDICVVAVLLYFGLAWFRERASRSVAIGILLIAALYVVAQRLEMYLTTGLFQFGFTAILLALIVVFQQDIRRAFERIATWRLFGKRAADGPRVSMVDMLVESMSVLAHDRTGALVVLAGREPVDSHVRGGVTVEGKISPPLLYSIFHTGSPGHDGAVLIEDNRIQKLGVHLPLSKNLAATGGAGTRHAAALGLAECCDALVIVVSEERGTVSVAEQGRLERIEPAELKSRLDDFFQNRFPKKETIRRMPFLTHYVGLKIASVLLAVLIWLIVAYRVETIQRTYVVPIEYRNLPAVWRVEDPIPKRAEITLTGSERAFDTLEADKLIISLDLRRVRSGEQYVSIMESDLKIPPALRIQQITPRVVTVWAEPANRTQ
jgi:uncharacterized protein (TIGR00159 family)